MPSASELERVEQEAQAGHNHVAADQMRLFIERAERLIEERDGISADIKDVMAEAKANGYDVKTLRKMISLRKMDKDKRDHQMALEETYMQAIGLL